MLKIVGLFLITLTSMLHGEIRFSHRSSIYATHQPILYEISRQTDGPIIEFGCGSYSTDLLHEICKQQKRLLISIDDDAEWLQKCSQKYLGDGYERDNSGWHKFLFVPGKNVSDEHNGDHWITFLDNDPLLNDHTFFDVCFVDQAPFSARIETIKRFRSKSRYVILHDCDYYPIAGVAGKVITLPDHENNIPGNFAFDDLLTYFKVYYPSKPWPSRTGPPTLLGSDYESTFPEIDDTRY